MLIENNCCVTFLDLSKPNDVTTPSSATTAKISAFLYFMVKDKGKAIPLQAWTGPEGSRRLRLRDFKTIGT
jgi:hypothetical protein